PGFIAHPNGAEFPTRRMVGYPRWVAQTWPRFPLSAAMPAAEAVRARQPVLLETWQERQARFPEFARVRAEGGDGALVALPMIVLGRVVGALRWSFPTDRTFDEQDRIFLLTLAEVCGQALERTRMSEAERQ